MIEFYCDYSRSSFNRVLDKTTPLLDPFSSTEISMQDYESRVQSRNYWLTPLFSGYKDATLIIDATEIKFKKVKGDQYMGLQYQNLG
jgi:hypothetical protein